MIRTFKNSEIKKILSEYFSAFSESEYPEDESTGVSITNAIRLLFGDFKLLNTNIVINNINDDNILDPIVLTIKIHDRNIKLH